MTSATTRTTPEQLYRLLADNATDVVTLHDLAGHYLYVSPSVEPAVLGRDDLALDLPAQEIEALL